MNELIESVLSMHLDVYRQSDIQDSDTGAIKESGIITKQLIVMLKEL